MGLAVSGAESAERVLGQPPSRTPLSSTCKTQVQTEWTQIRSVADDDPTTRGCMRRQQRALTRMDAGLTSCSAAETNDLRQRIAGIRCPTEYNVYGVYVIRPAANTHQTTNTRTRLCWVENATTRLAADHPHDTLSNAVTQWIAETFRRFYKTTGPDPPAEGAPVGDGEKMRWNSVNAELVTQPGQVETLRDGSGKQVEIDCLVVGALTYRRGTAFVVVQRPWKETVPSLVMYATDRTGHDQALEDTTTDIVDTREEYRKYVDRIARGFVGLTSLTGKAEELRAALQSTLQTTRIEDQVGRSLRAPTCGVYNISVARFPDTNHADQSMRRNIMTVDQGNITFSDANSQIDPSIKESMKWIASEIQSYHVALGHLSPTPGGSVDQRRLQRSWDIEDTSTNCLRYPEQHMSLGQMKMVIVGVVPHERETAFVVLQISRIIRALLYFDDLHGVSAGVMETPKSREAQRNVIIVIVNTLMNREKERATYYKMLMHIIQNGLMSITYGVD